MADLQTIQFVADGRYATLVNMDYYESVSKVLSYSKPGAKFIPAVREGTWDGRTRMMDKNGNVAVGLLRAPEIKLALEKEGFVVKLKKWSSRPVYKARKGFTEKDEKYHYQNTCVDAMIKSIPFGGGIVLSATGSGKTKIAAQFDSWIGCSSLFIVDQIHLLYQSAEEIEAWAKYAIGIVGNSQFRPSDRLTVATIQTLHKHRKNLQFRRWLKTIKIVIIDEVHVQMSRRNFSVVNLIEPDAVFGLTATLQLKQKPIRMKAFSICGPVLFEFPIEEGMDEGVLSKGVAVQVDVPNKVKYEEQETLPLFNTVKNRIRKHSDKYDKVVVRNEYTNNVIATFISHALNRDYVCLVLVERIAHLKALEQLFIDRGYAPAICYGKVKIKDRQKIGRRAEKGKENLILANGVFTKGINIKRLDLILDAAQRGNKNDTMQKFGRGVRLHSAKKGLLYYHVNTAPDMDKYAKKRQSALKAAKIPVAKTTMKTSREVLKLGEQMLHKMITQ